MANETHMISREEHLQITQKIRAAEKKTSGEIFAVVARTSDDYFYVSGFMAALWALGFGLLAALIFAWRGEFLSPIWLVGMQVITFLIFLLIFQLFPTLRLWFVPRNVAYRRASANAVRQFLAHGIHDTTGRSGILLFVSIAERYAEVVADSGINEKVDQAHWDEIITILTSHAAEDDLGAGFVLAVEKSGKLLAEHFPPKRGKANELDDKVVEL